jgi:hypothetical protein
MGLHPDLHTRGLVLPLHPHLAVTTEPQSLQQTTHLILVDAVDNRRSESSG